MKHELQVQQDVVAALDREPNVKSGSVGVEVHHGVVKLAGEVSDDATREDSKAAAREVDGVTGVVMDVDVAGAAPRTTLL
jgi:osmotically-inducible protein OsmY